MLHERVRNVHERVIAAPAAKVAALLETLGSPDDEMWRTRVPTVMVLDRGVVPGSAGGHGGVRYHVTDHVPGRLLAFTFDAPTPVEGTHRFDIDELTPGSTRLRHTLEGRLLGPMRWQWPLLVRAAHDTVIEDIHDHVERTLTGVAHRAQPASRRIALLVAVLPGRAVVRRSVPRSALLEAALPRVDASDAWATPLLPGDPHDVREWQEAIFTAAPGWVRRLMALRDLLVRPLGLETAGGTPARRGFPEVRGDTHEILTGVDDRHLSFRVSTRVDADDVTVSTLVQIHNHLGRIYWAVVRWFHPVVVRALVRRAPRPWRR
ncbi:DUF2867 domain-containing protein [Actinotalea sp. K2]|uniref:DUF2867 domain-containing protein n=1 Tax=Actinotalea sp. K2 TaxID=2939438 RepID=UPI0020182DCB|nr:DUF2867 domain-containing protein [Actinotalea sp. K2]MCL3860199.1 DUF2867 domain-containing protein [Actinotalea sp. K2]